VNRWSTPYEVERWNDRLGEAERTQRRVLAPEVQDIVEQLDDLYREYRMTINNEMGDKGITVEDDNLVSGIFYLNEFLKSAGL